MRGMPFPPGKECQECSSTALVRCPVSIATGHSINKYGGQFESLLSLQPQLKRHGESGGKGERGEGVFAEVECRFDGQPVSLRS